MNEKEKAELNAILAKVAERIKALEARVAELEATRDTRKHSNDEKVHTK